MNPGFGFSTRSAPHENEPPHGKLRGIQDRNPEERRGKLRGIYIPRKRDKSGSWKRRILFFVSILLAAALLYWVLRDLDWGKFLAILRRMDYRRLPLLFILPAVNCLLRSIRWRILLERKETVPLRETFWANMAGYLGNAILPARAGEFIRAAYLSNRTGLGVVSVLASGIAERILDVIALVVFASIALLNLHVNSGELQSALGKMAGLGMAGAAILIALLAFGKPIRQVLARQDFAVGGWKGKIAGWAGQLIQGLQALAQFRVLLLFGLLTILIWSADAMNTVFMASVLGIPLSFPQAIVFLAGLGLSSAVPSTPGYVGVYQFAAVVVLGAFAISKENALSLVLMVQIINNLVVAFLGIIGLWRMREKRRG